MFNTKTVHPVYTVDHRELIPAGTLVSKDLLESVLSNQGAVSRETSSLLRYGSVQQDILQLLNRPPYHVLFADKKQVTRLMGIMEGVRLVRPILESLDFFKSNDPYTYKHILSVFALTTLLAEELLEDDLETILEAAAGPTHDLGKVSVPLHILKKTAPLTRKELELLHHHSLAGYVLMSYYLGDTENLSARVARDHHERRDGSGYPAGSPLTDRLVEIIAVCDIYDALISSRPYRPISYDNRSALEEITAMAETGKFSWEVVQAIVARNRKDRPHFRECKVSTVKRGTPPPSNIYGVTAEEKE